MISSSPRSTSPATWETLVRSIRAASDLNKRPRFSARSISSGSPCPQNWQSFPIGNNFPKQNNGADSAFVTVRSAAAALSSEPMDPPSALSNSRMPNFAKQNEFSKSQDSAPTEVCHHCDLSHFAHKHRGLTHRPRRCRISAATPPLARCRHRRVRPQTALPQTVCEAIRGLLGVVVGIASLLRSRSCTLLERRRVHVQRTRRPDGAPLRVPKTLTNWHRGHQITITGARSTASFPKWPRAVRIFGRLASTRSYPIWVQPLSEPSPAKKRWRRIASAIRSNPASQFGSVRSTHSG